MEDLIGSLTSHGMTGIVTGALIFILWHVLTRLLPAQEQRFLNALERTQNQFTVTLGKLEDRWQTAADQVNDRIDGLGEEIKTMRHQIERRP